MLVPTPTEVYPFMPRYFHAPAPILTRQHRLKFDRDGAGQTELSSMRMPTEHEGKAGFGRLAVDFRRVRQQYREISLRYIRHGPSNVVCPVEVGIVDAGQMDSLIAAREGLAFVEQYPYVHGLQARDHLDGSHDCRARRKSASLSLLRNFSTPSMSRLKRSVSLTPVIAGQHADIKTQGADDLEQMPHGPLA